MATKEQTSEQGAAMWKMTLAVATAAAVWIGSAESFAGPLGPGFSMHQMSAFRIEPPRPGGLFGLPRGTDASRDIAAEATVDKRVQSTRRRPR